VSVDLEAGPEVDVVADVLDWEPPWKADLVVTCEVLEHAPDARGIVNRCVGFLAPGGRLLITCAGPGREPHSGHDGGVPWPGEHYANIAANKLGRWLRQAGLVQVTAQFHAATHDTYASGYRGG
jgi:SAM-dependent methyltransferase